MRMPSGPPSAARRRSDGGRPAGRGRRRAAPRRTAAPGRAARRPRATIIESPSKTSSSWPPTMLTYATVAPASARPAGDQRQPDVVLVQLVRRAVDVDDEPDAGPRGRGERAAGLPDVLADGQRDVDAADADDGQRVAGHEVAVLVEDAVVGQVVLEVAWRRPGRRAARASALRGPRPGDRVGADPGRAVGVEVADDDREVAEPVVGQRGGERGHARPGTRPRTTRGRRGPRPGSRSASSPGTRPGGRRRRRPGGSVRGRARRCRRCRRRSGLTWARAMREGGQWPTWSHLATAGSALASRGSRRRNCLISESARAAALTRARDKPGTGRVENPGRGTTTGVRAPYAGRARHPFCPVVVHRRARHAQERLGGAGRARVRLRGGHRLRRLGDRGLRPGLRVGHGRHAGPDHVPGLPVRGRLSAARAPGCSATSCCPTARRAGPTRGTCCAGRCPRRPRRASPSTPTRRSSSSCSRTSRRTAARRTRSTPAATSTTPRTRSPATSAARPCSRWSGSASRSSSATTRSRPASRRSTCATRTR